MTPRQLPLGIQLADTADFTSFVAGPNAAVADLFATTSQPAVLVGGTGTGKSHLLQAACRVSGASAYLPLGRLRSHDPAVIADLGGLGTVAVDDVHAVAGDAAWERAVLRLIDTAQAAGGRWLAALPTHPDQAGLCTPDLRSRLMWAGVHRLQPLDDAALGELLTRRLAARGLQCPSQVTRFVLRRVSRHAADIIALVDAIDEASLAEQRDVTIPLVRSLLDQGSATVPTPATASERTAGSR